jgi:hypothetical protein
VSSKRNKSNSKMKLRGSYGLSSGSFSGRFFVVLVSFFVIATLIHVQLDKLGENADHAKLLAQELQHDYISRNRVIMDQMGVSERDLVAAHTVVQR